MENPRRRGGGARAEANYQYSLTGSHSAHKAPQDQQFSSPPSRGRRRPRDLTEQEIQRAVFEHLRCRAAPGVFAFHVPNGGYRRRVEAAILVGLGLTAGVPDVIAIKRGQAFALELKGDGKLSAAQRKAITAMQEAGAICGVAHGLDAALEWLEEQSLLRGAAS